MPATESRELFSQDPEMLIEEQADGSAIVDLPSDAPMESSFGENLAETLSEFKLNTIASDYEDLIEKDREARKKRDEIQAEGIRRTGLGDDAPGGAQFDGASRVVHPVLAKGCIDYAAQAIREIFPANGPVKTKILGQSDTQALERARRKADYLNWQLTTQISEYRSEKEILLTQLPLGGSQYEKYWYDPAMGRIRMEFVPIDKVLLPYSAASFYNSPRVTHVQEITKSEFESRIESGFYKDIINLITDVLPEETVSEKANDKVEGVDASEYNEDGLRTVYEISCVLEIDEERRPYIVHLDGPTSKVVAIYRNWDENDQKAEKLDWWVEDKFIPWRGAYGIGLPHLIGGMAAALTGALRALLDSAHINNSPGAIKLKGGRTSGQNVQIAQTQVQEMDAPAGIDDIRKVMMPLPFNPPSNVLFQLLEWLTNQAEGVVATAEEKLSQVGDRTPVGTTMALIEQGSATYSAIHARLHESQRRSLRIICRLNVTYPDMESMQRFGVTPDDFKDNSDIDPVSDPHIFSEAQRYAQLQEQIKLTQVFPNLPWNFMEMARRAMTLLRVDGVDAILPKPKDPVTADPAIENVALMRGSPLKADIAQDHMAHIKTHLLFILSPIVKDAPGPMPQVGALMGHIQEHLVTQYEQLMQGSMMVVQASGQAQSPDQAAMLAAMQTQKAFAAEEQMLLPLLQEAQQVVQSKMPPPPVDPAVQKTFEAAMAEIKRKADADSAKLNFDKEKLAGEQQFATIQSQMDERLAAIEGQSKAHLEVVRMQFDKQAEEMSHRVDIMKNDADNRQHQMTELLKNRDDNQTAILIEQMKAHIASAVQEAAPKAEPQPENDAMLKQMQAMLGELEKARTGDALSAITEGLRSMIASQQDHQQRTMAMAAQLMQGAE